MPIRPENRHRYPANWKAISARIRTVRAAGRCECRGECGRGTHTGRCPNVNGGEAYGTGSKVVLTVAHLDHTPENCDEQNLRAMCQGCHLHYDREHHAQTAAATRRAAIEAAGQLALELGEFTFGPDLDTYNEEDLDALIEEAEAEFYDDAPRIYGEYSRPATRAPVRLDRSRDLIDLPPLDTYVPTARREAA